MTDFTMITHGIGFYAATPKTLRAVYRAKGPEPVYLDDTRLALDLASGLLAEGFTVTLDGRELCLASN